MRLVSEVSDFLVDPLVRLSGIMIFTRIHYLHLSDIITVWENCLKPKCNQRMFRYVSLNSMFGSFQEEATRTRLNLYC